jgi:hypothetical protein
MTVVHVYRVGTEYQSARTTSEERAMEGIRCRSRERVIEVLRRWGVDERGLACIFEQLETSEDAEVRI